MATVMALAAGLPGAAPVVAGGGTASQVSTGTRHACAVSSQEVWCWGYNKDRQLGDGTTVNRRSPVKVTLKMGNARGAKALDKVVEVAAGGSFTCARRVDAGATSVWCWGKDNAGQLGNGEPESIGPWAVKVAIPVWVTPTQLTAGSGHACVRTSPDSLYCWGFGVYGQVGDGNFGVAFSPVTVGSGGPVAAGLYHTCAKGGPGALCWGRNFNGQLGSGLLGVDQGEPEPVLADSGFLRDVVQVGVGANHSCARLTSKHIRCWGVNGHGQLGTGDRATLARASTDVRSIDDAWQLAVGEDHSCIFRNPDRKVWCWGNNRELQLGKGSSVLSRDTPVRVRNIEDAVEIDVNGHMTGGGYSCARTLEQSVWCWGSNKHGQLGNGGTANSKRPVRVNL